jgi:hypothetical protein
MKLCLCCIFVLQSTSCYSSICFSPTSISSALFLLICVHLPFDIQLCHSNISHIHHQLLRCQNRSFHALTSPAAISHHSLSIFIGHTTAPHLSMILLYSSTPLKISPCCSHSQSRNLLSHKMLEHICKNSSTHMLSFANPTTHINQTNVEISTSIFHYSACSDNASTCEMLNERF